MNRCEVLQNLISSEKLVQVPDVHDALTAKLAVAAGFEALYIGSFGFSACRYGRPDQSLVSVDSLIEQTRLVANVVEVPLVLDLEEGGGNAVTTYHNVRAAEMAGASAVQIEDHVSGKSYGRGGDLYPLHVATEKIRAASEARSDSLIVARTEALAIGRDISEALERAIAFAEAGADLITMVGLPFDKAADAGSQTGKPMAQFVFGQTREELMRSGIRLALYPGHSTMVQLEAASEWLRNLKTDGVSFTRDSESIISRFADITRFVGGTKNAELADRYDVI
jgi:2-methylisocitrate lyase-like PEP mutase family enzyme